MKILAPINTRWYLPVIDSLITAGHDVTLLHRTYVSDLDQVYLRPYFRVDVDDDVSFIRQMAELAKTVDYILPTWADFHAPLAAGVNRTCQLPGIQQAQLLGSKIDYYQVFAELDIPHPRVYTDTVEFPCVVKPTWGTNSIDVQVIEDAVALVEYQQRDRFAPPTVRDNSLIVQQYLPGVVTSVQGHVYRGQVSVDLVYTIESDAYPYGAETGFVYPSNQDTLVREQLTQQMTKFFNHIGLDNSPFMCDGIVHDGVYHVFDFGARLSTSAQMIMTYSGDASYGAQWVNRLTTGAPVSLKLDKAVIFRQLKLAPGRYQFEITGEVVADELVLPVQVLPVTNDRQMFQNGHAITTGQNLAEAEQKWVDLNANLLYNIVK
jgi:hypothetical protein